MVYKIDLKPNTKKQYARWIIRLRNYCLEMDSSAITLTQVEDFEQFLVADDLSPASLNQARSAINRHFAAIGRPEMRLTLRSTKHRFKMLEIVSCNEIQRLITEMDPFYAEIVLRIYEDLLMPGVAVAATKTRRYPPGGGNVHLYTLQKQVRQAAIAAGLTHRCTPKIIQQSGIVHQLERGGNIVEIAVRAGLQPSTMRRYIKTALGLPPG